MGIRTTPLTTAEQQRDAALAYANRVRIAKAKLKDDIHADATWSLLAAVLTGDKGGAAGNSLRVTEALTEAPALGKAKAKRIIGQSGALRGYNTDPRLRELTHRQRVALANAVHAWRARLAPPRPSSPRYGSEARRLVSGAIASYALDELDDAA